MLLNPPRKAIRMGKKSQPTMATSSRRTAAGVRVLTGKNVKFGEGSHRRSNPAGHLVIGIYQVRGRDFSLQCGGKQILSFAVASPHLYLYFISANRIF